LDLLRYWHLLGGREESGAFARAVEEEQAIYGPQRTSKKRRGVMNERLETVKEMRAVTISREYGSEGSEIAARLAQRLGWRVIDHAIVERAARALGTIQEEAEAHDEQTEGIIAQLLYDLQYIDPTAVVSAPPLGAALSDEAYRAAVERVSR
jgi:Cytidylate kinase-like family